MLESALLHNFLRCLSWLQTNKPSQFHADNISACYKCVFQLTFSMYLPSLSQYNTCSHIVFNMLKPKYPETMKYVSTATKMVVVIQKNFEFIVVTICRWYMHEKSMKHISLNIKRETYILCKATFVKKLNLDYSQLNFTFTPLYFPGVQFVPILPIKLVYHSQVLQAVSKCLHSICLLHNKIAALQDAYSTNFSLTISLCPMCLQGRL